MSDYEVGYCKPPTQFRFQKGVCPNPKGRGKKKPLEPSAIIRKLFTERVGADEKQISKQEYMVKKLAAKAMAGHVASAEMLIELYYGYMTMDDFTGATEMISEKDLKWRIRPGTPYKKGYPP